MKGIDFHCKRLGQKLGEDYDEVKAKAKNEDHPEYKTYSVFRTGVKEFSFQRAYGAGATAISEATGMSMEDVEQLIEDEKILYPSIEKFNEGVSREVHSSRIPTDDTIYTKSGPAQVGRGEWFSPTGTRYTFRESEAPEFLQRKGTKVSFSPPDLKNYPIQGTGGEVVQMVLGKLFRHYLRNDRYEGKALLVNTVHDCVWFDYEREVRERVLNDAIRIMQGIPTFLKSIFNIDCGVVFRVEAEYGDNMLNLHHWHSEYYI
jgi:DNA polymerase I-like protein with 3'-5' exonuclease and polymerase domains